MVGANLTKNIEFFAKIGYFRDSLAISKFLTRREMCFNGYYLYGGLVLKLKWLGTELLGARGPVVGGFHIIPAIVGSIITLLIFFALARSGAFRRR